MSSTFVGDLHDGDKTLTQIDTSIHSTDSTFKFNYGLRKAGGKTQLSYALRTALDPAMLWEPERRRKGERRGEGHEDERVPKKRDRGKDF